MLAMNYRGPRRVRIDHKPMPEILHPQDAIVRVTRSCICGSDIHLYNGSVPDTRVDRGRRPITTVRSRVSTWPVDTRMRPGAGGRGGASGGGAESPVRRARASASDTVSPSWSPSTTGAAVGRTMVASTSAVPTTGSGSGGSCAGISVD